MTQEYFDKLNNELYYEAKIYECSEKGCLIGKTYTSLLWERLQKSGWSGENHKGIVNIHSPEKRYVIQSVGMINALHDLGLLMR